MSTPSEFSNKIDHPKNVFLAQKYIFYATFKIFTFFCMGVHLRGHRFLRVSDPSDHPSKKSEHFGNGFKKCIRETRFCEKIFVWENLKGSTPISRANGARIRIKKSLLLFHFKITYKAFGISLLCGAPCIRSWYGFIHKMKLSKYACAS